MIKKHAVSLTDNELSSSENLSKDNIYFTSSDDLNTKNYKIFTVLEYVNITFENCYVNKTNNNYVVKLIPGELLPVPIGDVRSNDDTIFNKKIVYDWQTSVSINIPLLTPNMDSTFTPVFTKLYIPTSNVILQFTDTSIVQDNPYVIKLEKPLYIKATTKIGSEVVNVIVNETIDKKSTYYEESITFNIPNVIKEPTTKTYITTLYFYKDQTYSKLIGKYDIKIDVTYTSGSGD